MKYVISIGRRINSRRVADLVSIPYDSDEPLRINSASAKGSFQSVAFEVQRPIVLRPFDEIVVRMLPAKAPKTRRKK